MKKMINPRQLALVILGILAFPSFLFAQEKPMPEKFQTAQGELCIYPLQHASMVIEWNNLTLYIDPYGTDLQYGPFAAPDFVLITHVHDDHMNRNTLKRFSLENSTLVAPQAVVDRLTSLNFGTITSLENGASTKAKGVQISAIAMYNQSEARASKHPKGEGNGYVINLGGKKVYISGDTEGIPEMHALKNIDIAFVCMNLPYTMDVPEAAEAVLAFKPKVMYPYHYRKGNGQLSDIANFKVRVNKANPRIEVRLLDWYPKR